MKNKNSKYVSKARCAMPVFGLLLMVLAGFWRSGASAEMQFSSTIETPFAAVSTNQTDALGKLAFSKTVFFFAGASFFLTTANADGSEQATLTQFPPFTPQQPAWSPDGTKIVFTNFQDIFAINSDGTAPVNLTNTQTGIEERNPSWSANGKIAYERGSQIWTMNADGSNQAAFSAITQPSPLAPAWSFDGTKLAFTSGGEIYVINADGTNERRVTNNASLDTAPAWSPDGTKIVFSKGASGIAVINADGTSEVNLSNGDDREPSWSSDNTKIAFVRKGTSVNGIYIMDVTGANQVRIIADDQSTRGSENNSPSWQPVGVPINTFIISGRITRVGASLSGVTVTLSGSVSATTVTDATGSFQFGNLPNGGNYTVTPSLTNHVFTPPSRTFNNLNTNQIADFTAAETCSTPNCATNGKIAFVRNDDIFTMNPDGSNQTNITNNGATETEPNYSPDGSKII
ncbi:MAG: carboxypeptidase regulatory-like domain-containing protein, partial [Acidobacteriota bacterium]|nr:carboxypeptidase regulatory-like domain-containing protein [Acidobacteriota bacterium]